MMGEAEIAGIKVVPDASVPDGMMKVTFPSPELAEAIGRIEAIAHHVEIIHDGAYLLGDGALLSGDLRRLIEAVRG